MEGLRLYSAYRAYASLNVDLIIPFVECFSSRLMNWSNVIKQNLKTVTVSCCRLNLHSKVTVYLITNYFTHIFLCIAFNALTLLVGRQSRRPVNWVVRCCCGYLSGARCKWFLYHPGDATATSSSLASLKPEWFNLPGAGKEAVKRMCLSVCHIFLCILYQLDLSPRGLFSETIENCWSWISAG